MKIEFYNIESGVVVSAEDYFILNGDEVWSDNYKQYESLDSHPEMLEFEHFIVKQEYVGWRVVER